VPRAWSVSGRSKLAHAGKAADSAGTV
jgi:hypothetical protein